MAIFTTPVFATDVSGGETCDTNVLNTDTGPVNLRAEFEPETINLKWYNGNNQITVPTASNSCTYDTPISLPANPVKPGYKFKGWKVFTGIPIEYIQSTGTQYIDTGVPGDNNNLNFIVDFMVLEYSVTQSNGGASIFVTPYSQTGYNTWRLLLYGAGARMLFYTNTHGTNPRPSWEYTFNTQLNHRYLVDMNYDRTIVNGTEYIPNNLYIGTANNNTIRLFSTSNAVWKANIYSFKIYDNGTLIRDMVPVKDLSGVACMYDKVSGQFFYNAGTGDFIAGPEI